MNQQSENKMTETNTTKDELSQEELDKASGGAIDAYMTIKGTNGGTIKGSTVTSKTSDKDDFSFKGTFIP